MFAFGAILAIVTLILGYIAGYQDGIAKGTYNKIPKIRKNLCWHHSSEFCDNCIKKENSIYKERK